MRISRAAFDAIMGQAAQAGGEECCGLLLADPGAAPGRIGGIWPAPNVATDRRTRFEICPSRLIRAHKGEREGNHRIVGIYHSHPGGDPAPSLEDAAQAEPNGALWLICAGPPWTIRSWQAVQRGTVHGRFDAADLVVAPDP